MRERGTPLGGYRDLRGDGRGAEVGWKRCQRSAWERRIERRHLVQTLLHRQADRVSSEVADFDGGILRDFVLNAQGPRQDLRLGDVHVETLGDGAGRGLIRWTNERRKSPAGQKAFASSVT